jgi:hypothetical protein
MTRRLCNSLNDVDARPQMNTRPYEVPLLQPSRAQPKTKTIVQEHLHTVRPTVHEQMRIVRARLTEHTHDPRQRRINPRTHVERLHSQPMDRSLSGL